MLFRSFTSSTIEEADGARGADDRVARLEVVEQRGHEPSHLLRPLDQAVLFVDRQRGERGGAGERMAVVGEPAVEHVVLEVIGNRAAHADGAELHVRARQALRHRDDVGHHLPVIDREPLAGAAEAGIARNIVEQCHGRGGVVLQQLRRHADVFLPGISVGAHQLAELVGFDDPFAQIVIGHAGFAIVGDGNIHERSSFGPAIKIALEFF